MPAIYNAPRHSLSAVADLACLLRCFAPQSPEADLVRDLCRKENFGFLTRAQTASAEWARLAQAPVFRDIRCGIKCYNGQRIPVAASGLTETLGTLYPLLDLPEGDARKWGAAREVFITADYLDLLRAAANLAGLVAETAADYL